MTLLDQQLFCNRPNSYFLGEGTPWLEWRKLSSDFWQTWILVQLYRPTEAGQKFLYILTRINFLTVLAFLSCLIYIGAWKINNNTSKRWNTLARIYFNDKWQIFNYKIQKKIFVPRIENILEMCHILDFKIKFTTNKKCLSW